MGQTEQSEIPEWATAERERDLEWLQENVHIFLPVARRGYQEYGRGALVVDTTSLPVEGAGHPFGYFLQADLEERADEDTRRLLREYEPEADEFVTVLLKPLDRITSYRVRASQEAESQSGGRQVAHGQRTEPPDIDTLMAWESEGYGEATDGCRVEPDGRCEHGKPSWLIELGLI